MTAWNYIAAAVSVAMFAGLYWPSIAGGAGRVYQWGKSLLAGRAADPATVAVVAAGTDVTPEQAQAAELVLSRFIAKADKSDPTYKLIANGITTLAEQVK